MASEIFVAHILFKLPVKFLLTKHFFFSRFRYGLNWSAQTQNIGYSVCLSPELPYIDSSRQFWPVIDSHVTNESTNDTLATALSHSQISYKEESILPCLRGKDWAPVHGLMNLALVQRHRREFIGPRLPLTPLRLTGE